MKKSKRIICPSCKSPLRDVVEADVQVSIRYSITRQCFGKIHGPYFNILSYRKKRRHHKILSLNCRFCGKVYPKNLQKKVWKYLKYRKILDDLKED